MVNIIWSLEHSYKYCGKIANTHQSFLVRVGSLVTQFSSPQMSAPSAPPPREDVPRHSCGIRGSAESSLDWWAITVPACLHCHKSGTRARFVYYANPGQPEKARASGAKLRVCSACRAASYCDDACQRADWPAHKEECGKETARLAVALRLAHAQAIPPSLPPVVPTEHSAPRARSKRKEDIAVFILVDGFEERAANPSDDSILEKIVQAYMDRHYSRSSLVGRRVKHILYSGNLVFTAHVMPRDGVAAERFDRAVFRAAEIGALALEIVDLDEAVTAAELQQMEEQLSRVEVHLFCQCVVLRMQRP
jgi:hypothetical protein